MAVAPVNAPGVAGRTWLGTALVLVLVTTGALLHLDTRRDLDEGRDDLRRSRSRQATAQSEVAEGEVAVVATAERVRVAHADLAVTLARLAETRTNVQARTAERDLLRVGLDATLAELVGTRTDLTSTFEQLGLQAAQIESLDVCLNGVSRALLQLAFEDDRGAAVSLRRVDGACTSSSAAVEAGLPGPV